MLCCHTVCPVLTGGVIYPVHPCRSAAGCVEKAQKSLFLEVVSPKAMFAQSAELGSSTLRNENAFTYFSSWSTPGHVFQDAPEPPIHGTLPNLSLTRCIDQVPWSRWRSNRRPEFDGSREEYASHALAYLMPSKRISSFGMQTDLVELWMRFYNMHYIYFSFLSWLQPRTDPSKLLGRFMKNI